MSILLTRLPTRRFAWARHERSRTSHGHECSVSTQPGLEARGIGDHFTRTRILDRLGLGERRARSRVAALHVRGPDVAPVRAPGRSAQYCRAPGSIHDLVVRQVLGRDLRAVSLRARVGRVDRTRACDVLENPRDRFARGRALRDGRPHGLCRRPRTSAEAPCSVRRGRSRGAEARELVHRGLEKSRTSATCSRHRRHGQDPPIRWASVRTARAVDQAGLEACDRDGGARLRRVGGAKLGARIALAQR